MDFFYLYTLNLHQKSKMIMNKILTLLAFTLTLSFFNAQVFFENWDNPQIWQTNDADGDGLNWTPIDLTGFGTPIDFLGATVYSESWDLNTGDILFPDNYLISPAIDLSGLSGSLSLQFDVAAFDEDYFAENYSVYVVTDLADLGTANPIFSETLSAGSVVFNHIFDISSFAGQPEVYIVFRHHDCSDQLILIVDNIGVYHSDFSADVIAGTTCEEFTFTDNSLNATEWFWDFGDGANPATASTQGPHTVSYSTGGSKTISLTTNGVVTETKNNYLDVTLVDAPTFSYAQSAYCNGSSNAIPNFIATPGGFFSSSVPGFVDASTGEILLSTFGEGTYEITYTINTNCPASISIEIISTPIVNPIDQVTVCEGENSPIIVFSGLASTYEWSYSNSSFSDIGIATSGVGNIPIFTTINGTEAELISTFTVTPYAGSCQGLPVNFDFIITLGGSGASFTLSPLSVCSTSTNPLTSITGIVGGVFSSEVGLSIDPTTGQIDVLNSDPGTYIVRYDVGSGSCASFSTLDFELIETPTINPILDIEVCSGQIIPDINLDFLSTYVVEWENNNINTGISESGTANIASFTAINPTLGALPEVSTITLTANNNGCLSTPQTFAVTVNSNPVVNAGNDVVLCSGIPLTMTATGTPGTIFTWDNNINQGVAFTPEAGSYIYSVTGTFNGCSSVDQVNVLINLTPTIYAGEDRVVCAGSETVLSASGAPFLTWNNGVFDNLPFFPFVSQSYTVTGQSAAGCTSTDEIFITVEELPVPSFSANVVSACSPATIIFNSTNTTDGCIYSFSDGTTATGCFNVAHTFTGVGSYDVTLTQVSINQCVSSLTLPAYITINPDPVANFVPSKVVVDMIDPTSYFENTSTGAVSYEWNFGDNSGVILDESLAHSFPTDEANEFTVRLIAISAFGCVDTIFKTVKVEESLIFYIPNSFTPNGDEFNNTFTPRFNSGVDPQSYNMKIFNRFGQLIFESNDMKVGWDGDFGAGNGYTNTAVYTYKITFSSSLKDDKKMIVGNVNLLK
jgi:gliding motility-associated-like protein